MRVWLVDEREESSLPSLQGLLKQLAAESGGDLRVLGTGPFRPGLTQELQDCQLDLLVVHGPSWPEGPELLGLLETGLGLIVATASDQAPRFLTLAELYPVWLLSADPDGAALSLALRGTQAALPAPALEVRGRPPRAAPGGSDPDRAGQGNPGSAPGHPRGGSLQPPPRPVSAPETSPP